MAKALRRKIIEIDVTLVAEGATFGEGQGNTKHYRDLAMDVTVDKVGIPSKNTASVTIYNLPQEDVERLTVTSLEQLDVERNVIIIRAYGEGEFPGEVYQGEIFRANGIYDSPDLGIQIEAITGIYPALKPSRPFTFDGETDGIAIIAQYAAESGYSFENPKGLNVKIVDPVVNGSSIEKIEELARILGVEAIIDDGTVKVLPWGEGLDDSIAQVDADTGLIGYPSFNNNGIQFAHEYSPKFVMGGVVEMTIAHPQQANGLWLINKLNHHLQSEGAGADWKTQVDAMYPKRAGIKQ